MSNDRESNLAAHACLYHSRMQFLQDYAPSSENPLFAFEDPLAKARRLKKMPCPENKLLPPENMMTRSSSLRHKYLSRNGVGRGIRVMEGLSPKEEPSTKAKREAIERSMRQKELEGCRRKQKQKKKIDRKALLSNAVLTGGIRESESEGEEEDEFEDDGEPGSPLFDRRGEEKVTLERPDFSMFRKTAFYKAPSPTPGSSPNKDPNAISEEEWNDYPSDFDFLKEWKKEKTKPPKW